MECKTCPALENDGIDESPIITLRVLHADLDEASKVEDLSGVDEDQHEALRAAQEFYQRKCIKCPLAQPIWGGVLAVDRMRWHMDCGRPAPTWYDEGDWELFSLVKSELAQLEAAEDELNGG